MEHGQKCPPSFSNSSDTERVDVGGSLRLSLLLTDPSLFIEEIGAQDSTGQHFNLNFEEKKRTKEKKKSRNCFIHREIRKEMVGCFLQGLYIFLPP